MDNKERKIRHLLKNNYYLCTEYDWNIKAKKWTLYKKYDVMSTYFSSNNKPIMTSETHTLKDLYKFAKKHHKIDIAKCIILTGVIICIICLIVLTLNILIFQNDIVRYCVLAIDMVVIIFSTVILIIDNRNFNIDMLEMKEEINRMEGGMDCENKNN